MSEHTENLKHALATELNNPAVRDAFHAWIDHIESRLAGDSDLELDSRITALEKAVVDLHTALGNAPSPVTVQRAVENLEPPIPAG